MWSIIILGLIAGCLCQVTFNGPIKDREEIFVHDSVVPQLDGRIVGGWPTNITNHPHQTSLRSWHSHNCGASILSPRWILTAAHCLSGGILQYSFRLGSNLWAQGGILVQASRIIIHPLYNSSSIDYDIALVQINTFQYEVGDTIRYATLPPVGWSPTTGSQATVTGWGTPWAGATFLMPTLQEVHVPIVSNESCEQLYREWSQNNSIFITDRMLCAGFIGGGSDACQGDSGGPLVVDGYLTGVVSWGNGCAKESYPGVYASVPYFLSWIKQHTGIF